MFNTLRKHILGGTVFGFSAAVMFAVVFWVSAVAPGAVTNPTFGPQDDDVMPGGDTAFVAGNQINGLLPGRTYAISVYGYTGNYGEGGGTLQSIIVRDCSGGTVLAQTGAQGSLNWPDGQPPFNATLIVVAPASGCVQGFMQDSSILNMTSWAI